MNENDKLTFRSGADITVASVEKQLRVDACHGVKIVADALVSDCRDAVFDLIALPGGVPGATNLKESEVLESIVKKQASDGRLNAVICASPAEALGSRGLLKGLKATCYPSFMEQLAPACATTVESRVPQDGKVVTSRGPCTTMEFAVALVEQLYGKERADEVSGPLIWLQHLEVLKKQNGSHGFEVLDAVMFAIRERPMEITDDKWNKIYGNAIFDLHLALTDEVLFSVAEKTTAKEIWDTLTKLYETRSLHNKIFLKRKLYTLRMTESTMVTDHINTLKTLFSQLTTLGHNIEENEHAELLLQSLPDSYNQLIINLTNNNPADSLVFDDVAASVLNEESRRKNKKNRQASLQQAEALSATRGRSTERGWPQWESQSW
ncbi:protein DJ-1 [Citrus sinensis]|uniref:Protein DJ-1 n=1 Tax=Citrus sinensis TaxID=2711 RepID=A0ACB8M017_CITSI|nr:protein DJ-1 [Citrus sinensis]